MNLRLKAAGLVSIMFASVYLIAEFGRQYITADMLEYASEALLVYACYRAVLLFLEMKEFNKRPNDTFPDEKDNRK